MTYSKYVERDKYGRRVVHHQIDLRTICVQVTLPRGAREAGHGAYLVNDWRKGPNGVTYHDTLNSARAEVAGIIADAQEVTA